ncbi:MAG: SCP2 sterol-binding domain-containing protein [Chloroflexi bacterium]|jgi:putative sterol carrier protein|nr:SCP2 sterol-binding domain-containing protein [Chloroflexota bacterium]MBT3668931.1 SCP2 sterol-binding domain-containing protein [Chloroflexota bacterium]MBT4002895.1 SCP2 sterol-binding domain-containing protein [Chloroflexota bacterium]MBT4305342.1 SCP2 sterol-binding domain-containing protein [Chloroflexota bacterium]MBT4532488.1 SCP2 sterol-binding domain-containing protein [Chloroflexota bacterium]
MAITIEELFEKLPGAFIPEKAGDLDAVIQFELSGEEASDWYLVIKDKTVKVEKGKHESATMTLSSDSQDYKDIVTGKTNPMNAFMQGKVKLQGNLNLAMKFAEMFKLS